jgi:quercetin dioxygenase-like cupin family protein
VPSFTKLYNCVAPEATSDVVRLITGLVEFFELALLWDPVRDHIARMENHPGFEIISSRQQQWKALAQPGVTLALLHDRDGERTLLLRMEPGATFPRHVHPAGEQLYVLDGSVEIDEQQLGAGDYLYTAPGAAHAVASLRGCTLFITVPQPIEIVAEQAA